jgi:hypothetical protein
MIKKFQQPIEVLVAFMKDKILPLSFRWQNQKYSVNNVNMMHETRIGRSKWYYFSITSDNNYYQLAFDTETNKWFLTEAVYGA